MMLTRNACIRKMRNGEIMKTEIIFTSLLLLAQIFVLLRAIKKKEKTI